QSVPSLLDSSFFFQAEDVIRDLTVTGVQTCALPISCSPAGGGRSVSAAWPCSRPRRLPSQPVASTPLTGRPPGASAAPRAICTRSEERRVGKEGRTRWSADQYELRHSTKTQNVRSTL